MQEPLSKKQLQFVIESQAKWEFGLWLCTYW